MGQQQTILGELLSGFFGSLSIRNIGCDAAQGVTTILGIAEGKLDDDAGVEAVVMERRFFESHGFSGLQDLAVVVSKYGGLFRREDFLVGFTDEILVGQMGNDFKLTVRLATKTPTARSLTSASRWAATSPATREMQR